MLFLCHRCHMYSLSWVRGTVAVLLLAAFTVALFPLATQARQPRVPVSPVLSAAANSTEPAVEGWVTDAKIGRPVNGATVRINGAAVATTGLDGYFAVSADYMAQAGLSDSAATQDTQALQVEITQPEHAPWSISGAVYYKGDTLRLYPKLAAQGSPPTMHSVPGKTLASHASVSGIQPAISGRNFSSGTGEGAFGSLGLNTNAQVASQSAGLVPPATIRVYRTETQAVEVVPFKDYLKHVLPSEWIPTWGAASLKAGAMAVKSYAWYWVAQGGKQAALQADVKDNTEDQVYDPDLSYASTDAAVEATFPYVMTLNGRLFQAQYCSGSYSADPTGDCPWPGPYLTQWGSDYFADQGRPWGWILQFYYPGTAISPTPPGGGYSDAPAPTSPAKSAPTSVPTAPPAPTSPTVAGSFTVGQGADNPQVYTDAYGRNGGQKALGQPISAVHWWLQDISENNIQAQAFSGPDGKGNTWLVFDVLKSANLGVRAAFVLQGDIARAYTAHAPAGPNWVGAPTSDSYKSQAAQGGLVSQGFAKGTLAVQNGSVQFTPWPASYSNWKAEYFVGHDQGSLLAPAESLAGQPALVADVASPNLALGGSSKASASTLGVGAGDWSAQFTRDLPVGGGTYDFSLSADSGARLWVDDLLAINGWTWAGPGTQQAKYSIDLDAGVHTVRVQYFSLSSAGMLNFDMHERGATNPPHDAQPQPQPTAGQPTTIAEPSAAQLRVHVVWLGRGPAPSDSWVQPLTLQLSNPADHTVLGSYNGSTDRNGVAIYSALPVGVYDVHVKGPHSLQSARAAVTLSSLTTADIDMQALIEGDVDGDNCVTVDDLTDVQSLLGTDKSMPAFNASADLNGDGRIDLRDVSLLRSGFDMCGDVSADAQSTIQSIDKAPTLQQLLGPWLAPDQLQHNLAMYVTLSGAAAGVGQTVDVQVVADSGTQPVDGAAFVLKYDPGVLAPVDGSGGVVGCELLVVGGEGPCSSLTTNNSQPTTSSSAEAAMPGMALPSVLGSWLDAKGGSVGYAANVVQGQYPQGKIVVAKLHFKVLSAPASRSTAISLLPPSSGFALVTAGGVNLLSTVTGANLYVTP